MADAPAFSPNWKTTVRAIADSGSFLKLGVYFASAGAFSLNAEAGASQRLVVLDHDRE